MIKWPLIIIFALTAFSLSECTTIPSSIQNSNQKSSKTSTAAHESGKNEQPRPTPNAESVSKWKNGALPLTPEPGIVILDEKFFIIHYDAAYRVPRYVEYYLSAEHLRKSFVKRSNKFHIDLELAKLHIPPVQKEDYRRSGYDKGHLAPSGDFEWSTEANFATFTMANMAPQSPGLNRRAWEGLEEQVRLWACADGEVRVVTGPILNKNLPRLDSGVAIPQKFFKVVLSNSSPPKAIGFVMDQGESEHSAYTGDVVPILEIEKVTGVKFFQDLPIEEREKVETHADLSEWHGAKCKGIDHYSESN